jgi:SAM-dependent methyltransferase
MIDFQYGGTELELFAGAHNWKSYWSRRLRPYVAGDVLEVGAGIGSNTPFLDTSGEGQSVCLEPDLRLFAQLTGRLAQTKNPSGRKTLCGTLQDLGTSQKFDTIIYIDVLEHIENDREELENAASLLRPDGRIIVLSPAHQWLFTSFDAAIGHFRRYSRATLRGISPPRLLLEQLIYLDSVGLLFSIANRLFLRQSMPTKAQLRFWDLWGVPVSRVLDRCLFDLVGKSIIGIWRRESM